MQSVNDLINDFRTLAQIEGEHLAMERGLVPIGKYKEPHFLLKLEFMPVPDIPENAFDIEEIREYVPPPLGISEIKDFNILYHLRLKE